MLRSLTEGTRIQPKSRLIKRWKTTFPSISFVTLYNLRNAFDMRELSCVRGLGQTR